LINGAAHLIDYIASSNQAFFVIRLKPYEIRTDPAQSAGAIIARLRPELSAINGAIVFPFNLPPILGLGSTGGFQYVLELDDALEAALGGSRPTDVQGLCSPFHPHKPESRPTRSAWTIVSFESPRLLLAVWAR
jgi:hypothetical protein